MQSSGLLRMQRVLGGDLGVGEGDSTGQSSELVGSLCQSISSRKQMAEDRHTAVLLSDAHESLVAFSQN